MRLTLIYGCVFLASSIALLTAGYLAVRHHLDHRRSFSDEAVGLSDHLFRSLFGGPQQGPGPNERAFEAGYQQAVASELHRLLFEYIGGIILMLVVSVAIGWWMAGRALTPLRRIIATARRVSGQNLGERIALQGPEDELKELADTFDGMLARLDAAFTSQRHFVTSASHELRTPLAIMRTEVDVALADPDASPADLRAMGEAVRDTIDRSEALIASLLFLARSEGVHAHEEPVDIAELAAGVVTDLHRSAEQAGVEVSTELAPAVVRGDAELLERMLANLVQNAIRYNRRGGELSVATTTVDGAVQLLVRNSGEVIDPGQVQSLTEPFRRLSRNAGGFGLGLSIVRSVAEVHSGTIELEAPPEGGLEVRVRLPSASERTLRILGGFSRNRSVDSPA